MAQLQTHSLPDLVAIEKIEGVQCGRKYSIPATVEPGRPVRHKEDPQSYGMVLSRRWIWDDKPMQCEVLWSKEPVLVQVQVQSINASSRRLNTKWSAVETPDMIYGDVGMFSGKVACREPAFEVEEEFERLSYEEVQEYHKSGANVQLHSDGRVTVKRKTDDPPHDMNDDHRVSSRSIRCYR